MNFNPFKRSSKGGSKNTLGKILHDFAEMQPNSVNCSLLPADPRSEAEPEDLERAFIFKHGSQVLVKNKAFYITTPDGFRAEDDHMSKGAILHLWFLYNRVPYTIDTRVMGRIRFPDAFLDDLAPRIPVAYMLQPVGNIRKIENRQYLRYAHKVGHGGTRVYTQLLFDLYVTKTDISFPDTGSLPPNITDIHTIPYIEKTEIADQPPEEVVKFMKNAIRLNSRENRVVFVGKPYMDDRSNKVALLDMGKSDVLGLETARKLETQRQEESRSFYIRKPPSLVSDRKDPFNLKDGDTIVLNFNTTVSAESPTEYYDMISEVTRVGTENMTVRTNGDIRREAGLPIDLIDFGIGGIKMDPTDEFMNYILGSDHLSMRIEDKVNTLVNTCYLLNFYPKIRFNRETEIYQPDIPMKIQILSKIVRIESTSGPLYENGNVNTENAQVKDGEYPTITGLGVKFYYDPSEYSRDSFSYDRWDLIRDFKENKHFQEIHTSLNGLIAFIESQNR